MFALTFRVPGRFPMNTPPSPVHPVHPAIVCVYVPAALRLRTCPRSGRALKRLRMQPFLRCSDARANRGIFEKPPHYFRVIGALDLRKRRAAPIRRLRGNRRSGVFSSCGVRYNPNRCESNLLVRAYLIFPIGHALCLDALYVFPLLWLSSRSCDVVPYAVCVGGGFIVRRLR